MKSLIRGIGIGIIFTTLIFGICYMVSDNSISDSEVIERAKKLGMVEAESSIIKSSSDDEKSSETPKPSEEVQSETPATAEPVATVEATAETAQSTPTPTVKATEETKKQTTTAATAAAESTVQEVNEAANETAEQSENQDNTATATDTDSNNTVTVSISQGDGGATVSNSLQEKGIIENSSDFTNYLTSNGYQNRLSVGDYELSPGMSYEEIASKIVK